jgi:hypothetical protein
MLEKISQVSQVPSPSSYGCASLSVINLKFDYKQLLSKQMALNKEKTQSMICEIDRYIDFLVNWYGKGCIEINVYGGGLVVSVGYHLYNNEGVADFGAWFWLI